MFLIVHASVGAVIGDQLSSPSASFVMGFLSHFVIDMIPHGDEIISRRFAHGHERWLAVLAVLDISASLCLVTIFWLSGLLPNALGAFAGAVGAMVPDVLQGITIFSKDRFLPDFRRWHDWCHQILGREASVAVGGALQLITFVAVWIYPLIKLP